MPTIHFVYAGDPLGSEINSPYTITQNVYRFLKQKTTEIGWNLRYQNWTDGGPINHGPDDIIIGHPNYDPNTVIQATFRANKPCKAKFTMHPLHTRDKAANFPFNNLVALADGVFSICGPYWYDTIESTDFAHWKPKITRLDMGIDTNHYPFMKTVFNEPKLRRLLYVGSSTHYKNLSYLAQIMRLLPDVQLYWFDGTSEHELARLPNVRTTGNVKLDAAMGKNLTNACDMMVNVSFSDANPTTLLECASWGLPVACTPGSGYYGGNPFYELPSNESHAAAKHIKDLIRGPEEVLRNMSIKNRVLMESNYNWTIFCNKIWDKLVQYI